MTEDELKAIEARANAAMKGPNTIEQNLNFFAHARTDIPLLIADLRAAREALRFYVNVGEAMACGECIADGGDKARPLI